MKTTTKVSPKLVDMMVGAYGSIEAARNAYRSAKESLGSDHVLMVMTNGKIAKAHAAEVFYKGSPDAPFVLPS